MEDEEFWSNDPTVLRDSEWEKISSDFTNVGYREGITAGKESAVQQGFDDGFAQVGAPIGRELGILRGLSSALLAFLSQSTASSSSPTSQHHAAALNQVRDIANSLARVRFSDIAPPDLEAIAHAREHLDSAAPMDEDGDGEGADLMDPTKFNEEIRDKRAMEGLEDLMAQMSAPAASGPSTSSARPRPTAADVASLKDRLMGIALELGLALQWS